MPEWRYQIHRSDTNAEALYDAAEALGIAVFRIGALSQIAYWQAVQAGEYDAFGYRPKDKRPSGRVKIL